MLVYGRKWLAKSIENISQGTKDDIGEGYWGDWSMDEIIKYTGAVFKDRLYQQVCKFDENRNKLADSQKV